MKDVTLMDQIMNNLAFEVEAVPQEGEQISSASNNPINVKIRIRRKNKKQPLNKGVISIPKIDRSMHKNEKIRLSNSDQTIMSFNVLMEREESVTRQLPKQKRIFQLFKRGGCLGTQSDEDQYEYTIGTSKNKNDKLVVPMKRISSNNLEAKQFTLTKNYSNLEVTHESKQKHKDFLGKCKPGGCLDPPFGEDKYSYLPNLVDKDLTKRDEIKIKNIECECDETFTNNSDLKSNKKDRISNSALIKTEKAMCATDTITFPSISSSTEALNKHNMHRRTKSYSSSKENRSYNVPNQLLETYYISPKIKLTNKTSKSVSDSNRHSDTRITDSVLQNEELFLDATTLETSNLNEVFDKLINNIEPNPSKNVNIPLELNSGLNYNEEINPNFAISNAVESDNLRDGSIISNSNIKTENGLADMSAIPQNISSSNQNVQSSMIVLKLDKQQTPNLEMNKFGEDNSDTNIKNVEPKLLHNYKNYETVVNSQDLSFYTEHLNVKYSKTEDRSQRSEYSIKHMLYQTNKIDTIIATNADNEKFIVTSQNNKSDVNLYEKDQLVSKVPSITSKKSNDITNYKKSSETIVATPQDLIIKNKDLKKDTSNMSEESINKKNLIEKINALQDGHINNNNDLKIINTTAPFPLKEENQSTVETVTKSIENFVTENENNIETATASEHFLTVNNGKSNLIIINEGAEFPSKEIDQATIETVTKSIERNVPEHENSIETFTASPQNFTVDNKNSNSINVAAELSSTKIYQVTIETVTKNIHIFKTENENNIETVSASQDFLTFNEENLNTINESADLDLKEIDQETNGTLAKSEEKFIIKNNNDMKTVFASPQYLIVNNKDPNLINIAAEIPSKEIDQVAIETVTKSKENVITENETNIETVTATAHILMVNNKKSNLLVINEGAEFLSKEIDQTTNKTVTRSIESFVSEHENIIETLTTSSHLTVDNKNSNTINVAAELPSTEINQVAFETVTKNINILKTEKENNIETVSASPGFLTFNSENLNIINESAELDLKEIDQVTIENVKKSIASFVTTNGNSIETVSASPHRLTVNSENSNIINDAAELLPKEIEQFTVVNLTKSVESFVTKDKNGMETVTASRQYLIVNNKNSNLINVAAALPSKEIDQVTFGTIKKSVASFATINKNDIEAISTSSNFLTVNNENSNIINYAAELFPKEIEQLTVVNLTKTVESFVTKDKNGMETGTASRQYLIVNNKDSNLINVAAALPSKEIDQEKLGTINKSVASFSTINKNDIEAVSTSSNFLTVNNENSNIINEAAELSSKDKDLVTVGTLSKPAESFITISNNAIETVSALPHYFRVNTKDSDTINITAELPSKNVVITLIESLLDLTVNKKDSKIINVAEMVSSNGIETTIKMINNTEKNIATQGHRFSNEELKLKNLVPYMYDSTKEHIIDHSNLSTESVAKNSIETMTMPRADSSFKDENKDFRITDGIEVNIRKKDRPILIMNSPKTADDAEKEKSIQDKESLKIAGAAQMTHIDEATKSDYKTVESEDKSGADIFLVSKLKSYKTNSINSISTKENKVGYSNSIKNLNFEQENNQSNEAKGKVQNFHMDRSNVTATNPDEQIKLNKQNVPVITTISSIRGENKLQDDVNSVHSNIIDEYSSTIKQREIKTPIKPKTNIFESNNTKEEGNLKHIPLKKYNGKELIHIDMAFQSFRTDKDESFIKTLDSSSFINAKRYLNDNILQFKTILSPNEGHIKIPIDTNKDLVLYIATDRKSKYQHEQLNKTLPNVNMQLNSQHKLSSIKATDKGNLYLNIHPSANDFKTLTKSIKDRETISESNLQQVLHKVYKDKLLPLHDVIKELKNDIEELSKQQTLIKDKLNKINVGQSNRIHMTGNKCGCIEMFFKR